MTISAIAARRAQQQQQQQQQQLTSTPPSPSSEPGEQQQEQQEQEQQQQQQQEQQQQQQQQKTRYFTAATTTTQTNNNLSKSPKRRLQSIRSGFIDPESISDWTPIINQNYLKTVDQNQNQISIIGLQAGQVSLHSSPHSFFTHTHIQSTESTSPSL
jgi:hypothetical protein